MVLKCCVDVWWGIAMVKAGEVLFSLGWQSPRDCVSIKILVLVQP